MYCIWKKRNFFYSGKQINKHSQSNKKQHPVSFHHQIVLEKCNGHHFSGNDFFPSKNTSSGGGEEEGGRDYLCIENYTNFDF